MATNLPTKRKVESYDISKPDETLHLAADIANFIKEKKLCHSIQGREYVSVEAWQYCGSRLGIIPIIESVEREHTSDPTEYKYRAQVRLLNMRNGEHCGTGIALCSNREPTKKTWQEYAILSMAQTRAVGKAYRNILAWIIRAAGYEATPMEEVQVMEEAIPTTVDPKPAYTPKKPVEKTEAVQAAVSQPMPGQHISPKMKAEILLLANSEYLDEDEKQKIIRSVNTLTFEIAEKTIAKIKHTVADRKALREEALSHREGDTHD